MTSPENIALAEELLPRWIDNPTCPIDRPYSRRLVSADECRPAVALALQSKDDSAALEIDRLKGEIATLRAALEPFGKPVYRFGRVLRKNGGELPDDNDLADDPPSGIYIGDLRKARAALLTDGRADG